MTTSYAVQNMRLSDGDAVYLYSDVIPLTDTKSRRDILASS